MGLEASWASDGTLLSGAPERVRRLSYILYRIFGINHNCDTDEVSPPGLSGGDDSSCT